MKRRLLLAAATLLLAMPPLPLLAQPAAADAQRGRRLFLQCTACHAVSADAAGKIGPTLLGVVGRQGGRFAEPKPSAALAAVDFRWTPERLDAWLVAPQALVPGNAMLQVGIDDARQRADLIAYLTTLR